MKENFTYIIIGVVVIIGIILIFKYANKGSVETVEINHTKKQPKKNSYIDMRNLAFSVTAEQLGLEIPNDSIKVYGIISDIDMDGETATIVTFLTGEASIYLSSGGGFIGAGQHESVQKVTKDLKEIK